MLYFPWVWFDCPNQTTPSPPWISDTVTAFQARLYQAKTQARTRKADAQVVVVVVVVQ